MKIPDTPFSTRLSGSAKETELRLRSIFQWKKMRPPVVMILLTALVVLLCFGLVSCVAEEPPQEEPPVVETTPTTELTPSEHPNPEPETAEPAFSFADIQNHEFYFSSGAGAWATILQIGADGSFSGEYYDSDMGVTGEGYPNGTQYYCEFQGRFAHPVEVNAYTFSVQIESMNYAHEVGGEEIRDGIRYIYTQPNGLTDTDYLLIYLPGAPLDELPMEYLSWVGYFDLTATTDTQLPFYGLYNEVEQAGFSGYERIVPPEQPLYSEDTQAVLDFVDAMFAEGNVDLWAFLFPGTGPISTSMDDRYEQVRAVFARYEWTLETGKEPERVFSHDDWTMYLPNKTCRIAENTSSNWVNFAKGSTNVNYSYNGEPGSLSRALLELEGGPAFRLARVYIPIEGQDNQTLIESYEARFRELYLNSGAISDYKLLELSPIEVETTGPFFLFSFSVKPSDPDSPGWRGHTVGDDGWVDFSFEVSLSQGGYEDDSAWMCGFWQWPNEKY